MIRQREPWFDRHWAIAFCLYLLLLLMITIAAYLRILPTQLSTIPSYDILGHFLLFGIASYLSYLTLRGRTICIGRCSLPIGPVLISAIVLVDEMLQGLSPYRTVSLTDAAASFSGILLFYRLARAQTLLKH